jgi:membrane protein YdbS with pleckstrin-like domain
MFKTLVYLATGYFSALLGQIAFVIMKKSQIQTENQQKNCSFFEIKWLAGYLLLVVSSAIMVLILPFCDLVLMSSSSAAAIIFGVILSVFWLNEPLVWRYDMTAILVIILGSVLTVL